MSEKEDPLSRTIGRIAIVIAAVVALSLPGVFFGLSYQYQVGAMWAEAQYGATQSTRYVALNPEMWRFQAPRLQNLIEDDGIETDFPELRRIVELSNQVVIESEEKLEAPILSARAPLFDAGKVVGYFEVSRSFRPLLLDTGLMALLGLGLAVTVFSVLKTLPLRALSRALHSLRQSEQLFSKAFHANPDSVIISRVRDGRIMNVNQSFTRHTGHGVAEAIEHTFRDLKLWAVTENTEVTQQLMCLQQVVHNQAMTLVTHDGEHRDMLVSSEIIKIDDESCVLMVARDVTEQKLAEQRMAYLANYDHLTGLPNRALFRDRLAGAMHRAHRTERLVGLLYLDLDRFKQVNDSLGHSLGDELLKQVAQRLQKCTRQTDTVAPSSLLEEIIPPVVARLGGDEFIIVLEEIQHIDQITHTAQRILATFSVPFDLGGHQIFVGASIGITVYPFDEVDIDNLIRDADAAMYRAKGMGRNNFQFYTNGLNVDVEERLWLESQLRQALELNQFELVYQPKLNLRTNQIDGVEALLRWNSPHNGLVSPIDFIPVLEETGLIVPVGAWVLRTACEQAVAWASTGLNLTMAVNLSARQVSDNNLARTIRSILDETGLSAGQLELEVTESLLMEDTANSQATLANIKQMGVHISLDDFGTGYSSLAYLKRLPLDTLKIDRSFVKDLCTNPDDTAIVRTIIALARNLRLTVVAEGVETLEQLTLLREALCEQAQGYFISRPIDAVAFASWMAEHYAAQITSPSRQPSLRLFG